MKRLRHKIFFLFVGLLLIVQSIVLISNYSATEQQEIQQIETRLATARSTFRTQFENRRHYLAIFAETAAKDFGLKQVFEEDTRSLLVALNNHRKRINADLAMAVRKNANIAGQLVAIADDGSAARVRVGMEQGEDFAYMDWFEKTTANRLYQLDGIVYQLSFSPLKSGDLVIGWIGFGYSIDERLARHFSGLTGLTTEFAIKEQTGWRILSASPGSGKAGSRGNKPDLLNRIMAGDQPEETISIFYPLGSVADMQVTAALYGYRFDMLETIQDRWQFLFLLTGLTLLLSLGGAYWIAASISRPVQVLVGQAMDIAGGNYERSIDIFSRDELGQLALEFNQMKKAIVSREQTISQHAFHDSLTGLPNRFRLLSSIERMAAEPHQRFALLCIGPQQVREVSYSLGHDIGDQVVVAISERLQTLCKADMLFNIGDDSFAMLVEYGERQELERLLLSLDSVMAPFFELNDLSLHISLQIGIALFPEHDRIGAGLLEMASTALQHAQQNGQRNLIYDPALLHEAVERLQLVNGLTSAIDEDQLVLHFQPKLDIENAIVTEVEALVRWHHPERGMVPPDRFIGLAEQTGHIHQLTRWVFDAALRQHRDWLEQGIEMPIAVNLSAESLRDEIFYHQVSGLMNEYGLTPRAVRLEVTESVVVDDPETAVALLERFRQSGFQVSVDDYGTGYSSLAQLKRLPASELKIDKAFVMGLHDHEEDRVIVKSTIDLAHSMGMKVVAEGVENLQSLEWLEKQGCEMAQGYFICKPMPADQLLGWFANTAYFECEAGLAKAN